MIHGACLVVQIPLGIVSKVAIYRCIKLSTNLIEGAFALHPRVYYLTFLSFSEV